MFQQVIAFEMCCHFITHFQIVQKPTMLKMCFLLPEIMLET